MELSQDGGKCVSEMVKAVLILDNSKAPFKTADISKFLTEKPKRKSFQTMLEETKKKLHEMGFNLLEIGSDNSKSYILTSRILPVPSMYKFASDQEKADRTLLILILTFILMNDGTPTDVEVFDHLKKLNIYNETDTSHEYFGNLKVKILKDFVRQMYLEKEAITDSDMVKLDWGPRAHAEVSKKCILQFVCDVGYEGKLKIENLNSQLQKLALEMEDMCVDS